jgi:hypothetical protein
MQDTRTTTGVAPDTAEPATPPPAGTTTQLREWLARRVEISIPGWALALGVILLLIVALD